MRNQYFSKRKVKITPELLKTVDEIILQNGLEINSENRKVIFEYVVQLISEGKIPIIHKDIKGNNL